MNDLEEKIFAIQKTLPTYEEWNNPRFIKNPELKKYELFDIFDKVHNDDYLFDIFVKVRKSMCLGCMSEINRKSYEELLEMMRRALIYAKLGAFQ